MIFVIELIAWALLIKSYLSLSEKNTKDSFNDALVVCLVSRLASGMGECVNYGNLKALPSELCKAIGCGRATSNIVQICGFVVMTKYGVQTLIYFLPLGAHCFLKLYYLRWFRSRILDHQHFDNVYRMRRRESVSTVNSAYQSKTELQKTQRVI